MKEQQAEKLLRAMTDIGEDLIEEAGTVRKRKKTASWRWGAIAACLCLALMGTAVAAQYFGVRVIDGASENEGPDVWLEGGIAYFPVNSLSDEVEVLDDPFHAAKAFDSWDEMEGFIGVDMMNNPVLDASPAEHYSFIWNDGRKRTEGRFLAVGSAGLTSINTIGCYEIGEVDITVQGYLFTDRKKEKNEDWDERFLGYSFQDGTQVGRESYTASNGLDVQILTISREEGHVDKYRAVFSLNGMPYVVDTRVERDAAEAREVLIQILDGFQV